MPAPTPRPPPVHTFHLGLLFNSGADAAPWAGANLVTPFNGDYTAGPQVLSTQQFGATQGPLGPLGS